MGSIGRRAIFHTTRATTDYLTWHHSIFYLWEVLETTKSKQTKPNQTKPKTIPELKAEIQYTIAVIEPSDLEKILENLIKRII